MRTFDDLGNVYTLNNSNHIFFHTFARFSRELGTHHLRPIETHYRRAPATARLIGNIVYPAHIPTAAADAAEAEEVRLLKLHCPEVFEPSQ